MAVPQVAAAQWSDSLMHPVLGELSLIAIRCGKCTIAGHGECDHSMEDNGNGTHLK